PGRELRLDRRAGWTAVPGIGQEAGPAADRLDLLLVGPAVQPVADVAQRVHRRRALGQRLVQQAAHAAGRGVLSEGRAVLLAFVGVAVDVDGVGHARRERRVLDGVAVRPPLLVGLLGPRQARA